MIFVIFVQTPWSLGSKINLPRCYCSRFVTFCDLTNLETSAYYTWDPIVLIDLALFPLPPLAASLLREKGSKGEEKEDRKFGAIESSQKVSMAGPIDPNQMFIWRSCALQGTIWPNCAWILYCEKINGTPAGAWFLAGTVRIPASKLF